MIQENDIHQFTGTAKMIRELDVMLAGTRISRRMVVQKDQSVGIVEQYLTENGSAIDGCLGKRSL